jgi:DNA-binding NtrC family response regulator
MSLDVLVIDDESMFRHDLSRLLESEGFTCETAASGQEGLLRAEQENPSVVLTDLVMPGIGGLEVVDRLRADAPDTAVVVLTAFGSLDTAVDAFRKGAVDYLLKPVVPEDLFAKVRRILDLRRLEGELRYLRRTVAEASAGSNIIGPSQSMQAVRDLIERIAPAPSPVLILGPTGTGKELVARAIHEAGFGEDAPFVPINCAALPRDLIESELFGHVKGAFTGAVREKPGVFELAANGTLLLDELAEMALDLQPKLLRAIEEQQVTRVGGTRPTPTPVRIIASTNRDLKREVEEGRFREDLYYRLRVVEIVLPALRDRREDIPPLVEHLIGRLNVRLKRAIRGVEADTMRTLVAADWPGNVRELENVLERAMLLAEDESLRVEDLPLDLRGTRSGQDESDDLRRSVSAYEAIHIRRVLAETGGNREEASRRMGIDPSTLYRRLKELGIKVDKRTGA